ncbi:MAG TPA: hypothetical protein VK869_14905 [Rubrobacteraceae bacterium]|nr:hypothetical protein [Rubrobacteraceae bacterium]
MKVSRIMRWIGPVAIAGAGFAVISDQLGLVTHLPDLASDGAGYHAVGSGLFLLVFTLLLVGMAGLYVRPNPDGPKVIEYGDARARYVLVEESDGEPRPEERARVPRHHTSTRVNAAATHRRPVHRS